MTHVYSFNLECDFEDDTWGVGFVEQAKACAVKNLIITSPNQTVTTVNDRGAAFYENHDVRILKIKDQAVNFMPLGIDQFFPDLVVISITNCSLKAIEQADLKPFRDLQELYLHNNEIETISSDLFEFSRQLRFIHFSWNKIKFIGENVLKPLTKLRRADFYDNVCIATSSLTAPQMAKLLNEIKEKCSNWKV